MFSATDLHIVALSPVSFCSPRVGTEKLGGWNAKTQGFGEESRRGKGWGSCDWEDGPLVFDQQMRVGKQVDWLLPEDSSPSKEAKIRFNVGEESKSWKDWRDKRVHACSVTQLCLTLLRSHRLQLARLLCPWDFPGKNTRVGCHFLLQGIFLTQGSNLCLLHHQADFLPLSHLGSPWLEGTYSDLRS